MIPKRVFLFSMLAGLAGGSAPAFAELPVDTITVRSSLPPVHPYRLYFTDVALPHLSDGKLTVIAPLSPRPRCHRIAPSCT